MKIKGLSIGRGTNTDGKQFPVLGGTGEVYVGQKVNGYGVQHTIASMDFEPRTGIITIRQVDEQGKPLRRWTKNETVKDYQRCDFIAIRLSDNMVMYADEEVPDADACDVCLCGKPLLRAGQNKGACADPDCHLLSARESLDRAVAAQNHPCPQQQAPATNINDSQARQSQDPPPARPIEKQNKR